MFGFQLKTEQCPDKIVLASDINQIDNPYLNASANSFSHLIERMKGLLGD